MAGVTIWVQKETRDRVNRVLADPRPFFAKNEPLPQNANDVIAWALDKAGVGKEA